MPSGAKVTVEPSSWRQRKQQLSMLARALEDHFDVHLDQEEQVVFPAVSSFLSVQQQDAIAREMAARRA